jgi:hypothetical protein
LQDAASKYGFTFKVFDPNFNPQAQLKHVQNTVADRRRARLQDVE